MAQLHSPPLVSTVFETRLQELHEHWGARTRPRDGTSRPLMLEALGSNRRVCAWELEYAWRSGGKTKIGNSQSAKRFGRVDVPMGFPDNDGCV